jgi:DNA-directed RNA polymerase
VEEIKRRIKFTNIDMAKKYDELEMCSNQQRKIELQKEIGVLAKGKKLLQSKYTKLDKFEKTIEIAEEYEKYEKIYFVYYMDFRGRIYVLSDYLNYQGNGLARALINLNKKSQVNLY